MTKATFLDRRQFFSRSAVSIGWAAFASLIAQDSRAVSNEAAHIGLPDLPHFTPKAKRVIYLYQSGVPSQMDLFDYKPALAQYQGQELPDSIRQGQRLTGMTSGQKSFPVAGSAFKFQQHGESGAWLCELLRHTAGIVDDVCFIKSMHTQAINHDPAITFAQTGSEQAGRPCLGSWVSYGLGSVNSDLPAFVVLVSRGTGRPNDQPLYDRLWSSGFLPSKYQGVKFRSSGDAVLYLSNPPGIDGQARREMLDDLGTLNRKHLDAYNDPEIATRIAQYELAYRMQSSVPELIDVADEPAATFDMYGPDSRRPGTYAANCLLARRLAERDVRFIQLYHMGWDQHRDLPKQIRGQCNDTDQATAALVTDLKRRGLLEDTLIIWGGEFGRTVYCQESLTMDNYGRDHHPRCFTMWMAGAGIRGGITIGETDDYCYNITKDPVHVHDLNATIMHCLGIDHARLTFQYQGRHHRLTDVHGEVVKAALS